MGSISRRRLYPACRLVGELHAYVQAKVWLLCRFPISFLIQPKSKVWGDFFGHAPLLLSVKISVLVQHLLLILVCVILLHCD